jgi:pimeloyl-ACP methyl ester carboxylesterase
MAAIRKGYVDIPTGQIHYRSIGSGPAVLMMHQAGRTGAIYRRVGEFLAPHYRSIMVDLPGFGESDPLPVSGVEENADAMIELLNGLGIEDVRLTGHHTGAVVAGEIAAKYPERAVAFAPSGYPLYLSQEERRQTSKETQAPKPVYQIGGHSVPVAPELTSDGSHLLRLFQRGLAMLWYSKASLGAPGPIMLPFEHLDDDDLRFVNDYVLDGLRAISAARTLTAVRSYAHEARLGAIQCPTLFIWSTGPFEAAFCQRAEPLQTLVPGSKIAPIENGDIHVTYTHAESLGKVLLECFQEADAARSAA